MKKIIRTACLLAMVALVTVSCKKNNENTSFNVSMGETYGFEVGPSLDGSKAYFDPWDGYTFKWSDDDRLMAYNLATDYTQSAVEMFKISTGQGGHYATFNGPSIGKKQDIGFRLFYNGNMADRELEDGNRATFHVEAEQNYDPACLADPNAMVMASTAENVSGNMINGFVMNHIFGYLNVAIANNTTPAGKQVSSIVVEDAQWNLTGEVSLKLPVVDADRFSTMLTKLENESEESYLAYMSQYLGELGYCADGSGKTVTMNCNNFSLPYGQWQYFFISLRPGALYKGFTLTVNYTDGTSQSKQFDASMTYLIKPAYFRNIYWLTDRGFYM